MTEAHQRDVRDDQDLQQGQQVCIVLPNVTVLISFFFLTEGNKKNIDSQGEIRFSVFCHTYTVTLRQGFWDYSPGISKKNDTVVPFLLHTLNIVLSCTLDTNSPSSFSKDDAAKPACHEFCSAGSDEKLGKHTR